MRSLTVLVLFATWTAAASAMDLAYLGSIGPSGTVAFNDPSGVAVAHDGSIWVADYGLGRVLHFTPAGGYLGEIDPRPTQWRPSGVAVLSDGRIAVAAGDVTLHNADGSGMFALGISGGGYGIAADAAGGFWVTQSSVFRVLHWPDLASFYSYGPANGIALLRNGACYATSSLGNSVFRIPGIGGYTGIFPVWSPALFSGPTDIEPFEGHLLVADTWHHRLLEMNYDLNLLDSFGVAGSGPGQFIRPSGLAVAPDGTLYVSELDNNRVSIYGSLPVAAGASSWGRIKTLFR